MTELYAVPDPTPATIVPIRPSMLRDMVLWHTVAEHLSVERADEWYPTGKPSDDAA